MVCGVHRQWSCGIEPREPVDKCGILDSGRYRPRHIDSFAPQTLSPWIVMEVSSSFVRSSETSRQKTHYESIEIDRSSKLVGLIIYQSERHLERLMLMSNCSRLFVLHLCIHWDYFTQIWNHRNIVLKQFERWFRHMTPYLSIRFSLFRNKVDCVSRYWIWRFFLLLHCTSKYVTRRILLCVLNYINRTIQCASSETYLLSHSVNIENAQNRFIITSCAPMFQKIEVLLFINNLWCYLSCS